ncbi:MAG: putative rane protein [Frankiales bacterium]|nr:putative rane protein [Frankiales bacterium]
MEQARRHAVRELLADPDFRRLFQVRLAGQAGDGLFQGALFGATFFNPQKATSATEAAVAFATLLLPYSFVGPFAGVLLDRWSRQRVLAFSNTARAALLLLLAASVAVNGPTSPPTVGLALLVVSLNRFVLSGLSAALPQVVEARHLVTANSFTTTLGTGAATVGGFTSVGLRDLWGKGDTGAAEIACVAALVYLIAGGLASRIARRRLGPTDEVERQPLSHAVATVVDGLVAGARHVHARGQAARALVAITAHRFFSGLLFVSTLLLYTAQGFIHEGFAGLGQVLTATVAGGVVAALVTPRITRRVGTQRWVVLVFAGAAVVTAALVTPYTHASLLVAGLGLGFAAQASKICVDTLVQESVEDAFRGRVFSLYDTLFNVSFVAAALVAAVVVPNNGKSYAVLGFIACGYAATALLYGVFVRLRAPYEPPEPVIAAASSRA